MGGVTGRIFGFGWGLLWGYGMRLYVPFAGRIAEGWGLLQEEVGTLGEGKGAIMGDGWA